MNRALIIVESPTKVRTLRKFLSKEYDIKASVGHIKDLPKTKLGVDLKDNFKPKYVTIPGKKKVIDEIRRSSQKADSIYLAPDPDREGEAIAWHIAEEIKADPDNIFRAEFNEITRSAVLKALENPRRLNLNRYQAQQARRILDRLVGYELSPLLWKKVKRGLSAGRVQSVAVRIVCERENEIQSFSSREYWRIAAEFLGPESSSITARLVKINNQAVEINNQDQADKICEQLKKTSYRIAKSEFKERKKNPPPPFITSTLQQEAFRRLRLPVKKTMYLAQKLYEGIELSTEGPVGLITYMRTDSVRIAKEAIDTARSFIRNHYGPDYVPAKPNVYRSRKGAQEAHEAIRPASLEYPPEKIEAQLGPELFKLYQLIWNRFLASQFSPALYDTTTIEIEASASSSDIFLLRATGSNLRFPGFLAVYGEVEEDEDEKANDDNNNEEKIELGSFPALSPDDPIALKTISPTQHFTSPPPRFTEASLVRELEEKEIGRPSTYAAILSQIQEKSYLQKVKRKFQPTELGKLVNQLLVENFPEIVNVEFTAEMEGKLDQIESGQEEWTQVLKNFFLPFQESMKQAQSQMRQVKGSSVPTDIICDACGQQMEIRWGRNGEFLACPGYPSCRNTKNFTRDESGNIQPQEKNSPPLNAPDLGINCSQCGRPMLIKRGRFGEFIACSGYPQCKNTLPLGEGLPCPNPGCSGTLTLKRGKGKRSFYGCSRYPECRFILPGQLVREKCPQCHAPFLVRENDEIKCIHPGCDYRSS